MTTSTSRPAIYESGDNGIARFETDVKGAYQQSTKLGNDNPSDVAIDSKGNLLAVNPGTNTVVTWNPGASGGPAPGGTIGGPDTGLVNPHAIALDPKDNLYVLAGGPNQPGSILVYRAGARGDAAPAAIVSGKAAALTQPTGIAVDSRGYIYVTNFSGGRDRNFNLTPGNLLVFRPGAMGSATPFVTISGGAGALSNPTAVAVDAARNLYVGNVNYSSVEPPSVLIYRPNSRGTLVLSAQISGPSTGIGGYITGVAADSAGNIYVSTGDSDSVLVFAAGSNGNIAPIATISGSATGLNDPAGLKVDAAGKIYVANSSYESQSEQGNSLTVYASGSSGNAAPIAALSRGDTQLNRFVTAVAVDGAGNVYAASNYATSEITVYPPGTTDAPPIRTIELAGDSSPSAMVAAPDGSIYILQHGPSTVAPVGSLSKFAAGASGAASPEATISGPDTQLENPRGLALDAAGNVYVTAWAITQSPSGVALATGSVLMFSAGSAGDAAPAAAISGMRTQLSSSAGSQVDIVPTAVAVDAAGNIYAATSILFNNAVIGGVNVFKAGSIGNVNPTRQIMGSLTGLAEPVGMAVDAAGNIYVQNGRGSSTVFGSRAAGNEPPLLTVPDGSKDTKRGVGFALTQ